MLSKCANPDCTAPFHYLREGKLYQIDRANDDAQHAGPKLVTDTRPPQRLEYFWLCGPCSSLMTLAFHRGKGVVMVPLEREVPRRAAAS